MSSSVLPSRRELLHVKKVDGAHRVATRAALSVGLPLLVLVLTGNAHLAPYASFGAFGSLYGRGHEHLVRVQMQFWASVAMVSAVLTGVLMGELPRSEWVLVAMSCVIAATGEMMAKAFRFHPPGPLFMLFAFGAIGSTTHTRHDFLPALLAAGASATFTLLVGVGGVLFDPRGVRGALADAHWLRPQFRLTRKPFWLALGVAVAGSIAVLLGIGHPYWAMVAAVAPLGAPQVTQQVARAVHRIVGTTAGLLTSWVILGLHLARPWAVLAIAGLQFVTEMLIGTNYALALLAITPMALMMGQLVAPRPIAGLLFDRGVETVIGGLVGFALAVVGHWLRERRKAKVVDALQELRRSLGR